MMKATMTVVQVERKLSIDRFDVLTNPLADLDAKVNIVCQLNHSRHDKQLPDLIQIFHTPLDEIGLHGLFTNPKRSKTSVELEHLALLLRLSWQAGWFLIQCGLLHKRMPC